IKLVRDIHDYQHKVAAFERFPYLDHHLAAQRTVWFVHAGSIDEHNLSAALALAFRNMNDALNTVARSLRLGGDDGQFFADQRVEQRGLARVGAAENANKTGAKGHRKP